MHVAAEREVLEETGIKAVFDSVLVIRQAHGFAHGKSDMFIMVALTPESGQQHVSPCETEIEDAKWMPMAEYAELPFQRGVALYEKIRERCGQTAARQLSDEEGTEGGFMPFYAILMLCET